MGSQLRFAARASRSDHGHKAQPRFCPGLRVPCCLCSRPGCGWPPWHGILHPFSPSFSAPGPEDLILMGVPAPGEADWTAQMPLLTQPQPWRPDHGAVCAGATLGCEQAQQSGNFGPGHVACAGAALGEGSLRTLLSSLPPLGPALSSVGHSQLPDDLPRCLVRTTTLS